MLRRVWLSGLLGVALLCTVSSSAGSQATEHASKFQPPEWSRLQLTAAHAEGEGEQLAGWDGGYILVDDESLDVRSSPDGRDWRMATPAGLTKVVDPRADGRMTAGYGKAAYIVGWSGETLAVWRTTNGTQWQEIPLDVAGLTHQDSLDLDVSIAAGPRGVLVLANDADTPPSFSGFYVWRSLDLDKTFTRMERVRVPGVARPDSAAVGAVTATADGFLASGTDGKRAFLRTSANGLNWARMPTGNNATAVRRASPIGANGSSIVAFNDIAQQGQPLAIYRDADGAWHPSNVDPGRLPDAGVVPVGQWTVNAVCGWETGYIAIGNINRTGSQFAGMVWYSADGSNWTRQPVRANGFDTVARFMDVAESNGKVLIVAYPVHGTDLLMWQADMAG